MHKYGELLYCKFIFQVAKILNKWGKLVRKMLSEIVRMSGGRFAFDFAQKKLKIANQNSSHFA